MGDPYKWVDDPRRFIRQVTLSIMWSVFLEDPADERRGDDLP